MSDRTKGIDNSKVTREDIIYLAGLIDGDGCFYMQSRTVRTKSNQLQYMQKLQVQCITEEFIDGLINKFGGVKITYRKKPPRRWLFGIEFTGNLLTEICERLIPFTILKKPNCENMLEMRKTYNGTGGCTQVTDEVIAIRHKCFLRSKQLNTHKSYVIPPCCPSALSSEEVQVN